MVSKNDLISSAIDLYLTLDSPSPPGRKGFQKKMIYYMQSHAKIKKNRTILALDIEDIGSHLEEAGSIKEPRLSPIKDEKLSLEIFPML